MNKLITNTLLLLICLIISSCSNNQKKVLIFSKTAGWRHPSIEKGVASVRQMLESKGIQVSATEDANYFTEDSLKQYSAVIFLSTTGDVLDDIQQADFERFIQAGGGYVGIHAATDTEYDWPWYNNLAGAYFNEHPPIQEATLDVIKPKDACCKHLPLRWTLEEEWYNFKSINPDIDVLVEIDETTYEGGTNGKFHPMVWKHKYDGGQAFYTALGHKEETFDDSLFMKQVLAGIEFAMGERKLDYTKAKTKRLSGMNMDNRT